MKYISLLLFILLLCGCKQQELLNHLDQQQANDVLAVLQRHNINAEKKDQGKTGFSIFVEPTDFASAVDWLKIYNLPGKPDIQISQMFPADALVSSPRAEKARLYSAIEQRLEQSLKIMDGIISSRVHVSYDVDNGDSGKTALPIHISVLAVYLSLIHISEPTRHSATHLVCRLLLEKKKKKKKQKIKKQSNEIKKKKEIKQQ